MSIKESFLEISKESTFKRTIIDGINYECPDFNQMGEMEFRLAEQINNSGQKIDRIIALARGGLTWTKPLMDHLDIKEVSMIRLSSYTGINQSGEIETKQPLTDSIIGETTLIFDDVADLGRTLEAAKKYVFDRGCLEVKTATLCFKPWSSFMPDFYAYETKNWVVFPHERQEFIKQSIDLWLKNNVSPKKFRSRLEEIGLPKEEINYFVLRSGFKL